MTMTQLKVRDRVRVRPMLTIASGPEPMVTHAEPEDYGTVVHIETGKNLSPVATVFFDRTKTGSIVFDFEVDVVPDGEGPPVPLWMADMILDDLKPVRESLVKILAGVEVYHLCKDDCGSTECHAVASIKKEAEEAFQRLCRR